MRDDGALFRKTFNVLRFLREITQRNEEREIGVAMAGCAKHRVEMSLHVFPDAVTPRPDDHATAHVRGLGQLGCANDLLIPLGKVFIAARRNGSSSGGCVRHSEKELNSRTQNNQRPFSSDAIDSWRRPLSHSAESDGRSRI